MTGGRSQTLGKVRGRALSAHPSTVLTRTPSPHGEGFPSLFETVDSATPGMPFVQNDMRLRWEIGRRNYLLLVFIVEESSRQDKSSLLLHVWNNFISVTTTHLSDLLLQAFKNVFAFDLERLRNADLNDVHWRSICYLNSCHYLNPIS